VIQRYEPASFGRRLAAMLLDGFLWMLAFTLLLTATWFATPGATSIPDFETAADQLVYDWLSAAILAWAIAGAVSGVVGLGVGLAFEAYGWTPGKAALGVRVMREDAHRPGLVHGAARYIGKFVSSIPLLLGYLWMLWDPRRQTWHDKFAATYVVRVPREGPAWAPGVAPRALTSGARAWAVICAVYIVYSLYSSITLPWTVPDGPEIERWFDSLPSSESTPGSRTALPPPAIEG
jgi:uncharacterized RDD family membrane protein YckC